jgi:hypothetical protein
MSIVEPGSAGSNLIERARNILLKPSETWDAIAAEPATVRELYTGYAIPLAAIPAVCIAIGQLIFGFGGFGISFHLSPVYVLVSAVLNYVLGLAWLYVFALIVEGLAPNFGAEKDRIQALKLGTYSMTAIWVTGVVGLLPSLAPLIALGGLYSLYLCWLGLPKLMGVPAERAGAYFGVIIVVAIVVGIVFGAVYGAVTWPLRAFGGDPLAHMSGKVSTPAGSVDLGRLEEASRRAEAAAKQIQNGDGPAPTDPEALRAFIPASVAGYARTELSSESGGAGGIEGSQAEGRYAKGDASLKLTVTDMGGAAALAAVAGSFNVHSSKDTPTGYEKVGKVDGRLTEERYDRSSKHGEYSVMVGDRFMVQAEGEGATMDELKAAVASVPASRLEGMAKGG